MSEMSDPNQSRLQAVDASRLTPIVRKALGSPTLNVANWRCEPVRGGVGGALFDTFLYRFSGEADDQGVQTSWTMILKVLRARQGEQPADPKYWKREGELYRSGLLDDLPGDFTAPRCFGVEEYAGESCWIWMEELRDTVGSPWPIEHYRVVARHLGQFNGAYLVSRPLPVESWLSSGWFRNTAAQVAPLIPQLLSALNSPYLKGLLPSDAADQYARLWSERDLFLDALDRLPQTLCHLDVFRRNLIALKNESGYKTAGIDWAFTGKAALGAEIGLPVLVGLMMSEVDSRDTAELDKLIFEGYLEGLGDVGWQGDPQTVRLGYTAGAVAKYFEIANFMPFAVDEANFAVMEQVSGHPAQYSHRQAASMFDLALKLADEARELMSRVS